MPVRTTDIKWGSYDGYSGPYFLGIQKYALDVPETATDLERELAVTVLAEGGSYDMLNMYDRGVCSLGGLQAIEKGNNGVSTLLLAVRKEDPDAVGDVCAWLDMRGFFLDSSKGNPNVGTIFSKATKQVARPEDVWLAGSDGRFWTDEQRVLVKEIAIRLIRVWESEKARDVQKSLCLRKLVNYAADSALADLMIPSDPSKNTPYVRAARALIRQFSVNIPSVAVSRYKAVPKDEFGSYPWFERLVRTMVLGPEGKGTVAHWPARYRSIYSLISRLYSVPVVTLSAFTTSVETVAITEIQSLLVRAGYSLGTFGGANNGIDGRMGAVTTSAIKQFQQDNGLTVDGIVGPKTLAALRNAEPKNNP